MTLSKLTPNFEFVQPELSDPSDITSTNVNWTKIDTRLDKVVPKEKGSNVTTEDCANKLLNALSTGTTEPKDDDYFISQFAGGGTSTTTYHRRPVSALWNYIKSKAESVFSLKDHNHDGVYYKADTVRDAKLVLASPTNASGKATFRQLTPDDVGLSLVQIGNLHVWKKYDTDPSVITQTDVTDAILTHSTINPEVNTLPDVEYSVGYANKVGNFSLSNDKRTLVDGTLESANSKLKGRYVKSQYNANIYSINTSCNLSIVTEKPSTYITYYKLVADSAKLLTAPTHIGYVLTDSTNTYTSGEQASDGYWYVYHKVLGD